jgi:thioredoxin 1
MMKILGNPADFNKNVDEGVTLVDFYADWCGPCKALSPTLEELEKKFQGKLNILKVNVDDNQALAQEYGVRGIPALIFFKDGEVKNQLNGNQPLTELENAVNDLI